MPTLLELPAEIASHIANFVPIHGILVLRQTCRAFNKITWPLFYNHFECRNVMLHRLSLGNLKEISQYKNLGCAVNTLRVCTHYIPYRGSHALKQSCPQHPAAKDSKLLPDNSANQKTCQNCQLRRHLQEQDEFLEADEYRLRLAQVMKNLPNCRTLVLSDAHVPWGATQLETETGCELDQDVYPNGLPLLPFWRYVLDAMLVAAAESKMHLEKLDIYLGHRDELNCFAPALMSSLDDSVGRGTMDPVRLKFPYMTSLRIVMSPDFVDELHPDWKLGVARFFAMFPQLSNVELAFDAEDQYDESNLFPELSKILDIPQLKALHLAGMETTESELMEMLSRHQGTLEDITLREVKLCRPESWPSLLDKIWHMPGVRRVTMVECLLEYNFMTDYYSDLPKVASITDEDSFDKLVRLTREACKIIAEANDL